MRAIVFRDTGDIRLENAPEPKLQDATDAIVRITTSAICGTDLHLVRGTLPGVKPGTILGHEAVGIVEEIGSDVRNLRRGDRVVVASSIACGTCSYCRAGYFSQCDRANPNGPRAGTAFFGGPADSGPFDGLQAEYARVPFANVGLVRLPSTIDENDAILLSDIFPPRGLPQSSPRSNAATPCVCSGAARSVSSALRARGSGAPGASSPWTPWTIGCRWRQLKARKSPVSNKGIRLSSSSP